MNFHNLQHTRLLESRGVLMTVCSIKELCVVVGNNRRQTVHIDVIYIYSNGVLDVFIECSVFVLTTIRKQFTFKRYVCQDELPILIV